MSWALQLILGALCAAGVGIVVAVVLIRLLGLSPTPPAVREPNPCGRNRLTTWYCITCYEATRQILCGWKDDTENLLGDVCNGCKSKLKRDVDQARAKLRATHQSNSALDKVRTELHRRGVTPA